MKYRASAVAAVVVAATLAFALPAGGAARTIDNACPTGTIEEDGFTDVPPENGHERAIDCIVWWEITQGVGNGTYRPDLNVSRAQMASFIARWVERAGLAMNFFPEDHFDDDDFTTHETNINRLAEIGIVAGTGPRTYSPDRDVTRAQMATFLVRAYEFATNQQLPSGSDAFVDDNGSTHEPNINKAAAAGFADGTSAGYFSPEVPVRRDQMASFMARALDKLVTDGHAIVPVENVSLAGEGDTNSTEEFRLRSGDYLVTYNYSGDCSYSPFLEPTNEESFNSEFLPDGQGPTSGSELVRDIAADEYFVNMITGNAPDCPWTLEFDRQE